MLASPQDLTATYRFAIPTRPRPATPEVTAVPLTPSPVLVPALAAPGTVAKDDYLSQLMHRTEIGCGLTLIAMAESFGLGAVHELSLAHGKTCVAAYLVGSR